MLDADVAALDVLQRLVPLASHCVFSEPAALSFTGAPSPTDALRQLARDFPSAFMAVTVGPEGCWWFDATTGALNNLKAPKVDVVDTLSAGDVFHGAFAVGLAESRPMAEIIRRANGAAAVKCSRFGGRLGAPTRIELDAFLEQQDDHDAR